MEIEALTAAILGPLGGYAYAIWNSFKTSQREETNLQNWKEAMDKQVTIVKEMADAHKASAEAMRLELDTCHQKYEAVQQKLYEVLDSSARLSAKVEILERKAG